jgi:hypothetical protein
MAGRFAAPPAGLIQPFIMSPFELCEKSKEGYFIVSIY